MINGSTDVVKNYKTLEQTLTLNRRDFLKRYIDMGYGGRRLGSTYVVVRLVEMDEAVDLQFLSKDNYTEFEGTSTDTHLFSKIRADKFSQEAEGLGDLRSMTLEAAVHQELAELQMRIDANIWED